MCLPYAGADLQSAFALARAWYDKAGMTVELKQVSEALEPLNLLIDRFADQACAIVEDSQDELVFRMTVVRSMKLMARALKHLKRERDAIACYDDMIHRFEPVSDVGIEDEISHAMLQRAWLLGDLGRSDEEIAAYGALVARYWDNHLLRVEHTIISALTGKMQAHRDREEFEQAITAADEIIRHYEFDPGDGIAERVARTIIRRANLLNKLGRHDDELASYDKVFHMFGHFEEPEVRLHAAKAYMFKAVTLNDADQSAAEIECYDEVLRRYGDDADENVREVAADALIHKGLSLGAIADDAAQDTGEREVDAEIACYDAVAARYGNEDFIGLRRAVAEAQLHKGETLLEVGRTSEALACLDAVIMAHAESEDEDLAEIVSNARDLRAQI